MAFDVEEDLRTVEMLLRDFDARRVPGKICRQMDDGSTRHKTTLPERSKCVDQSQG